MGRCALRSVLYAALTLGAFLSGLRCGHRPEADAQLKNMDSLLASLMEAVLGGFGQSIWWMLKKARLVRSELSDGGAEVLGAAATVGLVVVAILVFW